MIDVRLCESGNSLSCMSVCLRRVRVRVSVSISYACVVSLCNLYENEPERSKRGQLRCNKTRKPIALYYTHIKIYIQGALSSI